MERATSLRTGSAPTAEDSNHLAESHIQSQFTVLNLVTPRNRRWALVRARLGCAALALAALVMATGYIVVPLALAVHAAVQPVPVSLAIAGLVMAELALAVTFIILKTQGAPEPQ
jgi:predicted membrane-bound dolichyl-phosphate-mannose-protein mannosyltransferase